MSNGVFLKGNVEENLRWSFSDIRIISLVFGFVFNQSGFELNLFLYSMRPALGIMKIIIITLFKSQISLAEHRCSTNWGDCEPM